MESIARSCRYLLLPLFLLLAACAGLDPANVDVQLPESAPQAKSTSYTQALRDLGLMTEIYGSQIVKIQSNPIGDNTGTSGSTGGEIPRDITEIIKSSLNSIGGQVTFIPYDPAFIQNQMVTGYSNFDNKLIPDVVISGGITEFDRGLETRGKGTDAGAEATFTNAPGWVPSKSVSLDYSDTDKIGLARITLDFNLLDFQTMAGIPRMNTTNSMEVSKGMAEREIGITLFGPTFGRKGSIKKVQGRHAAVRLLVEASMMQIVGKYLNLPYWKLLGEDAEPDQVVMDSISQEFYRSSEAQRIAKAQVWLFLMGHNVPVNGVLDQPTLAALTAVDSSVSMQTASISVETYGKLFQSVPIKPATLGRRNMLLSGVTPPATPVAAPPLPTPTPAPATVQSAPTPTPAPKPAPAPAPAPSQPASRTAQASKAAAAAAASKPTPPPAPKTAPAPAPAPASSGGSVGRKLSDEEW
ncbi:DUF4384 domain-containing protein [Trichloromonas acetexigens]|uniref:DUF4384 domain-containing protein n=1 Tax=Trichloromonas acetexigens TaxID=38815 RepID=UPI0014797760|nr:DUF4384 domain-containing protein [Desulfuromonas acetexigens]